MDKGLPLTFNTATPHGFVLERTAAVDLHLDHCLGTLGWVKCLSTEIKIRTTVCWHVALSTARGLHHVVPDSHLGCWRLGRQATGREEGIYIPARPHEFMDPYQDSTHRLG